MWYRSWLHRDYWSSAWIPAVGSAFPRATCQTTSFVTFFNGSKNNDINFRLLTVINIRRKKKCPSIFRKLSYKDLKIKMVSVLQILPIFKYRIAQSRGNRRTLDYLCKCNLPYFRIWTQQMVLNITQEGKFQSMTLYCNKNLMKVHFNTSRRRSFALLLGR